MKREKTPEEADKILKEIDWDTWINQPGMPPEHHWGNEETDSATALGNKYVKLKGEASPENY